MKLKKIAFVAIPVTDMHRARAFYEGVLNLNVVLRWEFNLGSTVYFVYTRAQTPATMLPPGEMGNLNLHSVRKAPASDVLLLKLSYWWG